MQKRLKRALTEQPNGTGPSPLERIEAMRQEMPQAGYLRQAAILKMIPISPATLWRWTAAGEFPKPVKLSQRVTGWRVDDVSRWLREQIF